MSRSEPTGIDLQFCETHAAIRIVMPDGEVLRYGSATLLAVDETGEGQFTYNYVAHLMEDSSIKQSLTKQADSAQLSVQNVDRAVGLTLNNTSTSLVGAKAVLYKVFIHTNGSKQLKEMLTGEVASFEGDENNGQLKVISDTAPNLAYISNRRVQSNCPLIFKGARCGYVGSHTTCNKLYEDEGGCSGRNNQPRFGGIVIKGTTSGPSSVIHGDVDTEIENIRDRYRNGDFYPDFPGGRFRMPLDY